jgi:hypothetical protein
VEPGGAENGARLRSLPLCHGVIPRNREPETGREKINRKPAAFVKNQTQKPAMSEIEAGTRGVLSGKPRRTTACLRASAVGKECAHLARSTARKTRGGGGELSEKSSSSDGVPAAENRGALSGRLRLNRGPACSPRETGFARSTYRRKLSEPQAKTEAARNPA